MQVCPLTLRKSVNKAYLRVKPDRSQIENFKKNILSLYDQIDESESEEFHKNIISEFLKNTWYSPNHYINTKGRSDLVIHTGKDTSTPVGVLFEAKKPGNRSEMPTADKIESKAFYELILYYLRERITHKNISIKYLIITNIYEWFIFSSSDFEHLFANNKKLVEDFTDFTEGRISNSSTEFFYKSIAEPFISKIESEISFTHFDIREFEEIIKNNDLKDDTKLIPLFKIFSPEHLLKLPFANDSNSLDKIFYSELLHIIGLEETKEGSKKVIGRKTEVKRNQGSLIENAIIILKSEDCISQLPKRSAYGNSPDEQLFNIALELAITWINRILFLKLLEGQLVRYNSDENESKFLNTERVHDYDELNKLFFQVLAVKEQERSDAVKQKFTGIPYLNSSLFEPSELEHKTIRINSLDDHALLPVLSNTVLKDKIGKKVSGEMEPLSYFFRFLDAYDFSSEGSEEIQEESKTLINASVLGLIFEKINGYKDGSFFTPGFITMYMCHETITRALVQKFNESKGWSCETITDIYNKNPEIGEANRIINSLKICDPAVGSGHFLVSALNEIIAIKSELGVLSDKDGKRLKDYSIEVINDELVVTDSEGKFFEYNPKNKESQRVQETLFREKQLIIENCLFGVDINPNSVKICRLRLWIELLKNGYYKTSSPVAGSPTPVAVLETLPNIDINIKCGNSLISRYPLDADIKTALRSSKWTVDNYRESVMTYRNAQSKDEKRTMEELIEKIKSDFETEVAKSDKRFLKLNKLKGELISLSDQTMLFELPKKEKDEWNNKIKKLTVEIQCFESQITEIKSNKIYENAFEWRFEFPEVLNNDGDFVGFDVVIGNPPYISIQKMRESQNAFESQQFETYSKTSDIYCLFFEKGVQVLRQNGILTYISSNSWMRTQYGESLRKYLEYRTNPLLLINIEDIQVFEEATVESNLLILQKSKWMEQMLSCSLKGDFQISDSVENYVKRNSVVIRVLPESGWIIGNELETQLKEKIENDSILLGNYHDIRINRGFTTGFNEAFFIDTNTKDGLIKDDPKSAEFIRPSLRGKDIFKYGKNWKGIWIIIVKSGWTNKGRGEIDAEEFFRKFLPAIYTHLKFIGESVKGKGKGLFDRDDKGDFWWELRPCAYYEEFEKEKIIWGELSDEQKFTLDNDGYFSNNTIFFITGTDLRYLLSILNSKIAKWYFNEISTSSGMGTNRWLKYKIEQLPIKVLTKEQQLPFINLVDRILAIKKSDSSINTSSIEAEIDRLVYELYGLTEEEIRIVEGG